jgi:hypothetical protein
MSGAALNPLPPLADYIEAALRDSIRQHGVLVPILVDQHGAVVDGHHRQRIAAELDVLCSVHRVELPDAPEERAAALVEINDARRQRLSPEQRREIVAPLREQGHSTRAIAGAAGASQTQVMGDLTQVNPPVHLAATSAGNGDRARWVPPIPSTVTGRDGKAYPTSARRARKHSKIVRLPGSPTHARVVLTAGLRRLRRELAAAREWCEAGHKPPAELDEELRRTREQVAGLLRDVDAFLGRDALWGEQPEEGELLAAAYLRRAVDILAATTDGPRLQLEDCRGHLDALDTQLRRLLDEDRSCP